RGPQRAHCSALGHEPVTRGSAARRLGLAGQAPGLKARAYRWPTTAASGEHAPRLSRLLHARALSILEDACTVPEPPAAGPSLHEPPRPSSCPTESPATTSGSSTPAHGRSEATRRSP